LGLFDGQSAIQSGREPPDRQRRCRNLKRGAQSRKHRSGRCDGFDQDTHFPSVATGSSLVDVTMGFVARYKQLSDGFLLRPVKVMPLRRLDFEAASIYETRSFPQGRRLDDIPARLAGDFPCTR
jgi:hypothetical protein